MVRVEGSVGRRGEERGVRGRTLRNQGVGKYNKEGLTQGLRSLE